MAATEYAHIPTPARPAGAVFSTNCSHVAAACADRTIRVWQLRSGAEKAAIGTDAAEFDALAIAPGGGLVAGGTHGGHYRIWSTAGGALLAELRMPYYPFAMTFSPDGKRLAIAPAGEAVLIVEAATGKKLLELPRAVGGTFAIVFSPDGTRIATADADTVVRIHDARNGELLARNAGFLLIPLAAGFMPDGKQLLAAGADKTLVSLSAGNGEVIRKSAKLEDPVSSLEISPDGGLAAALLMHADNLLMPAPVVVFETGTGRQLDRWLPTGRVSTIGWSGEGRLLAAAPEKNALRIWQVR